MDSSHLQDLKQLAAATFLGWDSLGTFADYVASLTVENVDKRAPGTTERWHWQYYNTNEMGATPLAHVCFVKGKDWPELAVAFVRAGANPNQAALTHCEEPPRSIFSEVVKWGQLEEAKQLLELGADPNYVGARETYSIKEAIKHVSQYKDFADGRAFAEVSRFIASLERIDKDYMPPLHAALESKSAPMVELLLEAGADPHAPCGGRKPIQDAHNHIWMRSRESMSLLVKHGARIEDLGLPDDQARALAQELA